MTAFPVAAQLIDLLEELDKSKEAAQRLYESDKMQTHRITVALVGQLNDWAIALTQELDSLASILEDLPPGHALGVSLRAIYNNLGSQLFAPISQAIPTKEVPDP
jgi:hypothetical protein